MSQAEEPPRPQWATAGKPRLWIRVDRAYDSNGCVPSRVWLHGATPPDRVRVVVVRFAGWFPSCPLTRILIAPIRPTTDVRTVIRHPGGHQLHCYTRIARKGLAIARHPRDLGSVSGGVGRQGTGIEDPFARGVRVALALLVLLVAVSLVLHLWPLSLHSDRLPQWDMAEHGVSGLRLASAVREVDPLAFVSAVHRMSVWPPLFPLLEMPAFLLFGGGYAVPRGLEGVLLALAVLAAYWAGTQLGDGWGPMVGGLTAALLATSPMYQHFGTIVMLETPGALLLLLALGTYFRFLKSGQTRDWTFTCLSAIALFFCKYNYGLIWLVTLGLSEALRDAGSLRALAGRCVDWLSRIELSRSWAVILTLYGFFLMSIWIAGGWSVEVAGRRIQATSLGNPTYVLYLLFLAGFLVRPKRSLNRLRIWYQTTGMRSRQTFLWVVLPIALWMLPPPHLKEFFGFLENRSSGIALLSLENLIFYPRAFIRDYSSPVWLGLGVLGLALASLGRLRSQDPRRRALALALVVGLASPLLHPYKLPRFFFTVAPLVWLSAATLAVDGISRLTDRLPRRSARVTATAIVLLVLSWPLLDDLDLQRLESEFDLRTVAPELEPVLEELSGSMLEMKGSALVGYWNRFSPALVEWHARQRHPGLRITQVPRDIRRWLRPGAPGTLLESLAADPDVERVFVLRLPRWAPAWNRSYSKEMNDLKSLASAIYQDPLWSRERKVRFEASGYRLTAYRKQRPTRTASPKRRSRN